jgi:hypothetical protein
MPADAVVLDANLLVLLVVGLASTAYIPRHKRLKAYSVNDHSLLTEFLSRASRIVVTPNTVTETSNLAGQIAEPARTHIFSVLRALLQNTDEVYIESQRASEHAAFLRLGVTDAVLLSTMTENHTLLTADLDLYLQASRQGMKAVNFNHHIDANRP